MSRKILLSFILSLIIIFTLAPKTYAIENPLTKPNNKVGIHILFTSEIYEAAKLVNSSGGDWGYVTIPIQTKDHDHAKWQQFMNESQKYHLIPILRLATDADHNDSTSWRKPQLADIVDLAQFLDTLSWPTKNRYIIVFNEVNRGDEWGGAVDPADYADLLSFAVTVFKSKNPDYFVISAGLDNAAPSKGTSFMNEYDFMTQMNTAVPGIFNQIDGIASHSYPNPGFSQPPDADKTVGVAGFKHERDFIHSITVKNLPIFITETGWSSETIPADQEVKYYQDTINNIWNDPNIVAITPFLLDARSGPFQKFSFLTATGSATKKYAYLQELPKIKGQPAIAVRVLAAETKKDQNNQNKAGFSISNMIQNILRLITG